MPASETKPKKRSLPSLVWLGSVVLLSIVAAAGSVNPDPLRRYAPSKTTLYVSVDTPSGRLARAYLPDGTVEVLRLENGVFSLTSSTERLAFDFTDPFPTPTPFENLVIRAHGAYGVMRSTGPRATLLLPVGRSSVTIALSSNAALAHPGIKPAQLPGSVFLWSTPGEPIAALAPEERADGAAAEGRFGNENDPDLAYLLLNADPAATLRNATARLRPTKRPLALPDGTVASEFIVDPDAVKLEQVETPFGEAQTVAGGDERYGAAISIENFGGNQAALLLSSNRALKEAQPLAIPGCPIQKLTTYIQSPFFALGADKNGHLLTCVENFSQL